MDWLKQMNDAVSYIEDNLIDEIDYAKVAQKACCSVYHFQRMFSFIAGLPLSEYIRRRRLALAAFDLQNSNEKVIDIGLKYSYDSPTAFTRAFQNMHGVIPTAARESGVTLKAYPPIAFHISIKGAVEMKYRIEEKQAFRVVGVKLHTTIENSECYTRTPQFWGENAQNGMIGRIASLIDGEPKGILGVSICNSAFVDSDFDYYIGVATSKKKIDNTEEITIPAATWAVFECTGPMPTAIQELQKRVVTEWLPASGYEYANAPDIEVYFDDGTKSDARSEVWLPIVKK